MKFLNVQGVNDVRQREIHTAEQLFPEPSAFEFDMAIEKLKRNISPGIDLIPEEILKKGVHQLAVIHKLSNSVWNEEELPEEWKESIIVLTYL